MAATRPSGAPAPTKVSAAQAVRDVFIASINKGQFPFAIIGAIAIIIVIRLPTEDVSKLVSTLLLMLEKGAIVGYILFVITLFSWFFHAQKIRKETSEQIQELLKRKRA